MGLLDCINDWGGFEKLIADLNDTGEVKVEHDVILTGSSGAPRQIDVLITHTTGLYEHKIIVECRYWKTRIKRQHVDSMVSAISDLGVSKGVFFTTEGYQKGAKLVAEKSNIDLFLIKELTDDQWGSPGRYIQFYLQVISRSITNVKTPQKALLVSPAVSVKSNTIELRIGKKEFRSETKTFKPDGTPDQTLEELIDSISYKTLRSRFEKSFTINGGVDCTRYMVNPVHIVFKCPKEIHYDGSILLIPEINFDLLIKIEQSNIKIDRLSNYHYALMIENCVSGQHHIASRKLDSPNAKLLQVINDKKNTEDVLKNGSVLQVFTDSWFDPKEVEGLKPIPFELGPKVR